MKDDTITTLRQPGVLADPLSEVLRNGARRLPDTGGGGVDGSAF